MSTKEKFKSLLNLVSLEIMINYESFYDSPVLLKLTISAGVIIDSRVIIGIWRKNALSK